MQTTKIKQNLINYDSQQPSNISIQPTDTEPRIISHTQLNSEYILNSAPIVFNFSAQDAGVGVFKLEAFIDGQLITDGQIISFSPFGSHVIEITAEDYIGNKRMETIVYSCGIYTIRFFNYNPKKEGNQDMGYKEELWNYNYSGFGKKVIILAEKPKEFISYYSPDFRIDPSEKNLTLIKSYLGKDDYALVIKDINTLNNVLSIKLNDIVKKYPNVVGSIGLLKWTDDGKYFWFDIFDGAYTKGFIRIDSKDWSYQVFEIPNDMDIGVSGPLNFDTGYTLLYPGFVWTGVVEMDEQISQQWLKEGKQSEIYLYNLFTKQKELIATTTKPLWNFNGKWLSNTKLQYEMPSGEKKIYIVK